MHSLVLLHLLSPFPLGAIHVHLELGLRKTDLLRPARRFIQTEPLEGIFPSDRCSNPVDDHGPCELTCSVRIGIRVHLRMLLEGTEIGGLWGRCGGRGKRCGIRLEDRHWMLRNREERAVQREELMQLEVLGTDSRVH